MTDLTNHAAARKAVTMVLQERRARAQLRRNASSSLKANTVEASPAPCGATSANDNGQAGTAKRQRGMANTRAPSAEMQKPHREKVLPEDQRRRKKKDRRSTNANGGLAQRKEAHHSLKANEEISAPDTESVRDDADVFGDEEEIEDKYVNAVEDAYCKDSERNELVGQFFECRKRMQQEEVGQRDATYRSFEALYAASLRIVKHADALRSFVYSGAVAECTAISPDSVDDLEGWFVFAIRFAYWGPNVLMQKRASKFAALAEYFARDGIKPDRVYQLMKERTITGLLERATQRRKLLAVVEDSLGKPPGEPLRDFDREELSDDARESEEPMAIAVEAAAEESGEVSNSEHGAGDLTTSDPLPGRARYPVLKISLEQDDWDLLYSLGPDAEVVLHLRRGEEVGSFACIMTRE